MGEYEAVTMKMINIQPREVHWLWPGLIPRGKLTILCGDPGLGKSFVTLDLCARASRGGPWPFQKGGQNQGENGDTGGGTLGGGTTAPVDSVLLSAEDDPADTIRPRLEAMGADLNRVSIVDAIRDRQGRVMDFVIGEHSRDLAKLMQAQPELGLVVVDPVSAYVGGTDSYNNAQVRSMLKPLADIAADHDVAVVLVTHMRKSEAAKALHGAMGSLAFTAAARVVLMAMREPEEKEARLLLTVKSNLSSDRVGYRYRITDGRVEWVDLIEGQADEIIEAARGGGGQGSAFATFGARLLSFLRETGGARPAREVEAFCKSANFSWARLQRPNTKLQLGVGSRRDGAGWAWHILKQDQNPA